MIHIGIDPGKTGAVAIMEESGIISHVTLRDYSDEIFLTFPRCSAIFTIEEVHAMPKNGSIGGFKLGMNYGRWLGWLEATYDPETIHRVSPQKWKKHFGLLKKPKDASRLLAIELFPYMKDKLRLKKHHNRAEALLIAEYGRRMYGAK